MKTAILLSVCAAFLCAFPAFAGDAADGHASRAAELRAEGRFEEALIEYREAVRLSGLSAEPAGPRSVRPLEAASRLRRANIGLCIEKAEARKPA